jgi:hypothetical protein
VNWFYLVLGGLVTFRLALLVSHEDGPAFVFRKLRRLPPPKSSAREGLSCPWCVGVWASGLVTGYYGWLEVVTAHDWPLWWLAMSAIAIVINQQWTAK